MTFNLRTHPASELSEQQLSHLAQRLLDKRDELTTRLKELNQQITARRDCSITDAAEAAAQRETIDRADGIAAQLNLTLAEIDHALERMVAGSYGISEVSGEPIPYQRLLLLPWARTTMEE